VEEGLEETVHVAVLRRPDAVVVGLHVDRTAKPAAILIEKQSGEQAVHNVPNGYSITKTSNIRGGGL
jgi:type III secretory pathway component EscU